MARTHAAKTLMLNALNYQTFHRTESSVWIDPVSALGLASAVVAIVDFSWKLVTGAWEIHQSLEGVTAENAHLEDVTGRLEDLMQALTTDVPIKTMAERNVVHLANECKRDAEGLRVLLMEMKASERRRSLWKSLHSKWKSILNRQEVAQLKNRLQESRANIQFNIMSMLKEDQSTVGLQLARIEQDCKDLKTSQLVRLNELKAELLASLRGPGNIIQQQLQDIQRSIATISIQHRILRYLLPDETDSRQDQIFEADPETCRWILEPEPLHDRKRCRQEIHEDFTRWLRILRYLLPDGTDSRQDQIFEADQETCHCILEPESSREGKSYRQEIHEDFVRWLRTGKDVLHISGNPGSGKSTLMKFIAGNPRTQEQLKVWAGGEQLIFAQFYVWIAGTEAQRTLPGMVRSLLFQVLSQHPDLIEAVFPSQFDHLKASIPESDHCVEIFQGFKSKGLLEAFDLLLSRITKSNYKVFFLIDGLDEFEGGDLDHEDLAERLKSWTIGGNIKLLVSSRPWRPFLTTFTTHRTLHLHELNHVDIKTYAISQLCQDREIRRIGVDSTMKTIIALVEELSSQAQGIFLWAHLVLETVRNGIRRQYSVNLLKAKIREYPSNLDDLYDALREPIEKSPIDKRLSNRMLILAASAPRDFPLYALAFSWLPEEDDSGLLDPGFPQSTRRQPYSGREIEERLQCVAKRIDGLTRGLLELSEPQTLASESKPKIRFCHRTARDYLITNGKRLSVMEDSWPGFHQSDPYGRVCLAELIYTDAIKFSRPLNEPFCRDFNFETIRKFEEPARPMTSSMFRNSSLCRYYSNHETKRANFLRYAASCGLALFVLYEAVNYFGAYLDPPEIVVLLADALFRSFNDLHVFRDYQLALGLLKICLNSDIMVETDVQPRRYPVHRSTKLPVWIVGLIVGLGMTLGACSEQLSDCKRGRQWIDPSLAEVCRFLNELAIKLGQRLSVMVEVKVFYRQQIREVPSSVDGTQRTLSAARILNWAESLSPGRVKKPESVQVVTEEIDGECVLVSEERRTSEFLDTPGIMREENFPGALRREYQIVSWNLASTSGSIDGTTKFRYQDLWDIE